MQREVVTQILGAPPIACFSKRCRLLSQPQVNTALRSRTLPCGWILKSLYESAPISEALTADGPTEGQGPWTGSELALPWLIPPSGTLAPCAVKMYVRTAQYWSGLSCPARLLPIGMCTLI